jgi:hypothetical protein
MNQSTAFTLCIIALSGISSAHGRSLFMYVHEPSCAQGFTTGLMDWHSAKCIDGTAPNYQGTNGQACCPGAPVEKHEFMFNTTAVAVTATRTLQEDEDGQEDDGFGVSSSCSWNGKPCTKTQVAILGGGAVLGLVLFVVAMWACCCRKRRKPIPAVGEFHHRGSPSLAVCTQV